MNYYNEIKQELLNNEINRKVKNYSINRSDLNTYYNVGKMLSEAGKHYGEGIIKEYSIRLTKDLGKGYTFTALTRMRKLFILLEKVATVSQQLSYGHYVELLPIEDIDQIKYYIQKVEEQNLSIRELRKRIRSREYERLPKVTKEKFKEKEAIMISDLIPNPILIKNSLNHENISEKILQKLILEDISSFMEELGTGYSFIKNEYKIKIGGLFNYIDLLLFNIKYNAYVVIELKVTDFKAEYISQVQKYMNYIDKNIKEISNNSTIGIIICKRENKFVIEYVSDPRIKIRTYELV